MVLAELPLSGVSSNSTEERHLVEPGDGGTQLWPYTAESLDHDARTLGINMVSYGSPGDVRVALTRRSALEWEEERIHEGDADEGTISHRRVQFNSSAENMSQAVSLSDAEGSTRYTYFVVDFATMGVPVLPLRVVLHRIGVLLAIGLVAVGATMVAEDDPYPAPLCIGLAGRAVALLAPLFGYPGGVLAATPDPS